MKAAKAAKPVKPAKGVKKVGRPAGKQTVAKAAAGKRGPRGAMKLYYRLVDVASTAAKEHGTLVTPISELHPLTSLKVAPAMKEVLALSQAEENRVSHLGQVCQVVALMDVFKITGDVKVQVKAERC